MPLGSAHDRMLHAVADGTMQVTTALKLTMSGEISWVWQQSSAPCTTGGLNGVTQSELGRDEHRRRRRCLIRLHGRWHAR